MTPTNLPISAFCRKFPLARLMAIAVPAFLLLLTAARLAAQPTITNQPASRVNNVGDNAQFTVGATGSGTLTYKWQFNSVDIAGATTNTLSVLVTDTNKAGNY